MFKPKGSERTNARFKPKFPAMFWRLQRQKVNEKLDWYASADEDGNVKINPIRETSDEQAGR